MTSFLSALGLVFVAELGDKSQLMAMAFASRLGVGPVLLAVVIGSFVLHGVAVGIGAVAGAALPRATVSLVAGLVFVAFAAWSWFGGLDEGDGTVADRRTGMAAVAAAMTAFVLAELGDKTQLTSIALAATNPWLPTWLGASVGMVAVDGIAVVAGHRLGRRLSPMALRVASTVAFLAFGLVLLLDAARA